MAKRRKRTPKDWAAYDERTRVIQARMADLRRRIEERERAEQKPAS